MLALVSVLSLPYVMAEKANPEPSNVQRPLAYWMARLKGLADADPIGEVEAAMVAEMGQDTFPLDSPAIVFIDGKYAPPPHTLKRKGAHVYLNDTLVSRAQPHWPPQVEPKVLEDPGLPPDTGMPGIANGEEAAMQRATKGALEESMARNMYWDQKWEWFYNVAGGREEEALSAFRSYIDDFVQSNDLDWRCANHIKTSGGTVQLNVLHFLRPGQPEKQGEGRLMGVYPPRRDLPQKSDLKAGADRLIQEVWPPRLTAPDVLWVFSGGPESYNPNNGPSFWVSESMVRLLMSDKSRIEKIGGLIELAAGTTYFDEVRTKQGLAPMTEVMVDQFENTPAFRRVWEARETALAEGERRARLRNPAAKDDEIAMLTRMHLTSPIPDGPKVIIPEEIGFEPIPWSDLHEQIREGMLESLKTQYESMSPTEQNNLRAHLMNYAEGRPEPDRTNTIGWLKEIGIWQYE